MTLTKADKKQFFEAGSQNALDKKSRLMIPGWFDARLDESNKNKKKHAAQNPA